MPRVRLLARMNIADGYHERGEEVDVPGDVASYLAALSRVEIVRGEQPESPEAHASKPERAAHPRKRQETR